MSEAMSSIVPNHREPLSCDAYFVLHEEFDDLSFQPNMPHSTSAFRS